MKKIYTQPGIETMVTTPQQILCASGGIKAQISGYKQNTGTATAQLIAGEYVVATGLKLTKVNH